MTPCRVHSRGHDLAATPRGDRSRRPPPGARPASYTISASTSWSTTRAPDADASVLCGPLAPAPGDPNAATNPAVICEVLSPSTEAYDRGGKFEKHRALPCVKEYVLVAQDRALVEVLRRDAGNTWALRAYGPGARVELATIDVRIAVDDLDRGVLDAPEGTERSRHPARWSAGRAQPESRRLDGCSAPPAARKPADPCATRPRETGVRHSEAPRTSSRLLPPAGPAARWRARRAPRSGASAGGSGPERCLPGPGSYGRACARAAPLRVRRLPGGEFGGSARGARRAAARARPVRRPRRAGPRQRSGFAATPRGDRPRRPPPGARP